MDPNNCSSSSKMPPALCRRYITKADIEGAERQMLFGARSILKNFRPRLAVCTYHLKDDPQVLTQIIQDANPDYRLSLTPTKLFGI